MKEIIFIAVVHLGLGGPVEMREELGACPLPPLNVPLTLSIKGCYVEPKGAQTAPFTVIRHWKKWP